MIQRVQTVFLLAATILSAIIIFHPVSYMTLSDGSKALFTSFTLKNTNEPPLIYMYTFPIGALAIATSLISFITIFLFQNRTLQMRLCVYDILLTIGLGVLMIFYYFKIKNGVIANELHVYQHSFTYTIIFPLINIILLFQAFRTIRRDDLLLKSADRLR